MKRLALVLVLFSAACSDPSNPQVGQLTVTKEGWVERGGTARFQARDGNAVVTTVAWSAEPAASVQWLGPGEARFLATGNVRITADGGDARGTLDLDVKTPPALIAERVVNNQRDLWRVSLDGADVVRLTNDAAEDRWPSVAQGTVYFVSFREIPAAVYGVGVTGGTAARVTTVNGTYEDPVISPNGQSLAFSRPAGGINKLFISDRNGQNARRIDPASTSAVEVAPAWSPDGTKLAFVSTSKGSADIWVADVAGGAPQAVVSTSAPEVEPAWSPDSREIVFVRSATGGTNLVAVNVATRQERQLVTGGGTNARPTWLPDGRVVYGTIMGGIAVLHWLDPEQPQSVFTVSDAVTVAGRVVALP